MAAKEVERIAEQLERAFSGDAWHGPSLEAILRGVDARIASRRPIAGAHTIWEIVRHIAAWDDEVRRRLEGGRASVLPEEQDWPDDDSDDTKAQAESAWGATLDALRASHLGLKRAITKLSDEQLDDELPGDTDVWSRYATLHGIVQHDLYHAGQIALLKKALDGESS